MSKPILIHTDVPQATAASNSKRVHLPDLNEILSDYLAMALAPLTGAEFQSLIHDPKSLIFDKVNGDQPLTFNGMDVSKAKAMELVKLPEGTDELCNLIEAFRNNRKNWQVLLSYTDVVNGNVVLKQSVIDEDIECSKIYLTTDKEKALHLFLEAVKKAAIDNLGPKKFYHLGELISKCLVLDQVSGSAPTGYKIIPNQVKGFESFV